jgi:tetratricopeptide (TPR) repeat protein
MRGALAAVIALTLGGTARAEEIADAKIHYQAGVSYYEHADYLAAMREFNEAYRLSHRGPLLFNIAQCEEKLGMWADAVSSLRAYLSVPESVKDRALVEEKLKKLEPLAQKETHGPPREREEPPPPPPPSGPKVVPLAVAGAGAVLLIAAVITGIAAHAQYGDLAGKCGPNGDACPPDFESQRDLGRALAATTDVLLAVGVVAAAVGVVLYFVTREAPARAALLPRGAGAPAEVRF